MASSLSAFLKGQVTPTRVADLLAAAELGRPLTSEEVDILRGLVLLYEGGDVPAETPDLLDDLEGAIDEAESAAHALRSAADDLRSRMRQKGVPA